MIETTPAADIRFSTRRLQQGGEPLIDDSFRLAIEPADAGSDIARPDFGAIEPVLIAQAALEVADLPGVPGVNYLGRSASIILAGGSEACWV